MPIGYFLLAVFGAYVAVKYYSVTVSVQKKLQNNLIAPPGVNTYCCSAAPNLVNQVQAFNESNLCSTAQPGFAASIGPNENQPDQIAQLEI
jgi:hypothetical protein